MKKQQPVAAALPSDAVPETSSLQRRAIGSSRRAFLAQVGGATAATIASAAVTAGPLASMATAQENDAQKNVTSDFGDSGNGAARKRAIKCFNTRLDAAQAGLKTRIPDEVSNGDENRFPNRIGSFSKGSLHNSIGEADSASYASLLRAVNTGDSRMFDQIIMGGTSLLIDPQAGLAFDLEGADSHALAIGIPPPVASREIADVAVENYWMALCRDINFTQYGNEPLTQAAIIELNSLQAFHGPKPVTPQNLFRGFTPGDLSARTSPSSCCSLSATARFPSNSHSPRIYPTWITSPTSLPGYPSRTAFRPPPATRSIRIPNTCATEGDSAPMFTSTFCSKPISTPA